MSTAETKGEDVASLNVVLTSCLVLGGISTFITGKQTTDRLVNIRLNDVIEG